MRGKFRSQRGTLCLMDLESLVPTRHPARQVKAMCLEVLREMDAEFYEMYSAEGRVSVPPVRLLMSWVLMAR